MIELTEGMPKSIVRSLGEVVWFAAITVFIEILVDLVRFIVLKLVLLARCTKK